MTSWCSLRDTMGKKLGYDGFTPPWATTAWAETATPRKMWRSSALPWSNISSPWPSSIYREQASAPGQVSIPMNFADNALMFRSGNPKPCGDTD